MIHIRLTKSRNQENTASRNDLIRTLYLNYGSMHKTTES
jgi:hypothetical protein